MPLSRSACQSVAMLMAITGLSSSTSSAAACSTKLRLVPTCTIASTSDESIWSTISAMRAAPTSAMAVAVGQRSPVMAATENPASVKYSPTWASAIGWYGENTAIRSAPNAASAARHDAAPVLTDSPPDRSPIRASNAALPATPPQNVSADIPMSIDDTLRGHDVAHGGVDRLPDLVRAAPRRPDRSRAPGWRCTSGRSGTTPREGHPPRGGSPARPRCWWTG